MNTAKELISSMDHRPYKTIEIGDGGIECSNLLYTETIKNYRLDSPFSFLYGEIPCMYAILKVTGEDILIPIHLEDNKTIMMNVEKNVRCVLYIHKDLHILDSHVKCNFYKV